MPGSKFQAFLFNGSTMKNESWRFNSMRSLAFLTFLFFVVLVISCKKTRQVELRHSNGQVSEQFQLKTINGQDLKDGPCKKFDENGKIIEESNYVNGKLNGIRKLFLNGILQSEENRVDDKYEGPYKAFFPNGQLQLEALYSNDIMSGDVKVYYISGQLKEVVRFADNVEDGPFIEYYENGKLKAEGNYKPSDGPVENGELKLYDTTGTLIKIMNCNLGKCSTIWKKDSISLQ